MRSVLVSGLTVEQSGSARGRVTGTPLVAPGVPACDWAFGSVYKDGLERQAVLRPKTLEVLLMPGPEEEVK